jgi:hypothetical protein
MDKNKHIVPSSTEKSTEDCWSIQHCSIILPRSWNGKRVFAVLKDQWDEMQRRQERKNTQMVGRFVTALSESGGVRKCNKS